MDLKRIVFVFFALQFFIRDSLSSYLDTSVFQNLSSFRLPTVVINKLLTINFTFDTSKNEIVDCVSYNATQTTNLERFPYIALNIPLEAVNLRGKYFSSLNIKMTNGAKIFAQSNFGTYTLSMRDVNLYFELGFKWTTRGIMFEVNKCLPHLSGLRMRLKPSLFSACSMDTNVVEQLLEIEGKIIYSRMFCNALETILNKPYHPIVSALIRRVAEKINSVG